MTKNAQLLIDEIDLVTVLIRNFLFERKNEIRDEDSDIIDWYLDKINKLTKELAEQ